MSRIIQKNVWVNIVHTSQIVVQVKFLSLDLFLGNCKIPFHIYPNIQINYIVSPESNICPVQTNSLSILCLQLGILRHLISYSMLVSFQISNLSSSVLEADMELHSVRECPEKPVETFLKFYFTQLPSRTKRNVNKNCNKLTLKLKYNKMNV